MDERTYLKVKIKSLAEEAKIIRAETKKAKHTSIKDGLYRHRIDVVRVEARSTHLAYGFLRGRGYRQMESVAHSAPDWKRVRKMVEKYGTHLAPWCYTTETYDEYSARCKEAKQVKEKQLEEFDRWVEQAKTSTSGVTASSE